MIVTSVTHRPSTSILCLGLQEWALRTARRRRDPLSAREKTTPPSLAGKGEKIAWRWRLDTGPGVRWKWFGGACSECRTRARLTLTGAVSRMVPQRDQETSEHKEPEKGGGPRAATANHLARGSLPAGGHAFPMERFARPMGGAAGGISANRGESADEKEPEREAGEKRQESAGAGRKTM